MAEFAVVEPMSVDEVLDLLARHGEEAKLVAGGTWVTLVLRQGLLRPSLLVSLRRVSGLAGIAVDEAGNLRLEAMVRLRSVETSALVWERQPVVAETYREVANVRVRYQATVGGNLCDADYASDPPALLAALGARVVAVSQRGRREIPVCDFIVGHYQTVLEPDELVTEVIVPPLPLEAGAVYLKYRTRSHEDRPCLGVAAVVVPDGRGHVARAEVVVGAVAERPQRLPAVLDAVAGRALDDATIAEIAERYAQAIEPLSDLRGSAWYRAEMIRVFVERALRAARERAHWEERRT
jgi:carbon-monoxide dehydrogenase medium subunit